jgi:hypothetical protein
MFQWSRSGSVASCVEYRFVCTLLGGSFERRKCSLVTGLEVGPADQAVGHASQSRDLTEILPVMGHSKKAFRSNWRQPASISRATGLTC